jgi:hypothetical protein
MSKAHEFAHHEATSHPKNRGQGRRVDVSTLKEFTGSGNRDLRESERPLEMIDGEERLAVHLKVAGNCRNPQCLLDPVIEGEAIGLPVNVSPDSTEPAAYVGIRLSKQLQPSFTLTKGQETAVLFCLGPAHRMESTDQK